MTTDQQLLLRLLAEDLVISFDANNLSRVVRLAAEADTHWHRQGMTVTVQVYEFRESGNDDGAVAVGGCLHVQLSAQGSNFWNDKYSRAVAIGH